ncbi:MAG: histidinol dehydrogenase [Thermoleophilia bacterium]|nr:histidinol dehydrogenase [Thermoleophilia bacterium]
MKTRPLARLSVASEVEALRPSEATSREVADVVARLLADVRARGDAALVDATRRFDWPGAAVETIPVSQSDLESAYAEVDPAVVAALQISRDNCTLFHRHELVPDWEETGPQGQRLGIRHLPVERAGLYVPGGLGAYASTVVMNAVPAQVAGVSELIICTPPGRDGKVNSSVLAAARLVGVDKVFRAGGAQAIAAMAYGTETVPRVDVIGGPGNAYVMEAKRQVYGTVGIDSLAGPSEVLVVADRTARPEWIAADLLAQEEHGMGAAGVLMGESAALCEAVQKALDRLRGAGRGVGRDTTTDLEADSQSAAFYPTPGEDFLAVAEALVNAYAPEHLEIQIADPRGFLSRVKSAGAVFVGHLAPTAFGDYIAGSNHVLPTEGSARFASGLSVNTFMKRSSYVEMTPEAVRLLTPHLAKIADSEGFFFHRVSAESRSGEGPS